MTILSIFHSNLKRTITKPRSRYLTSLMFLVYKQLFNTDRRLFLTNRRYIILDFCLSSALDSIGDQ